MNGTEQASLQKHSSAPEIEDAKPIIGCFSHLHQPFVLKLGDDVTGLIKKNAVFIKDKCSYAFCKETDTVAFCGGVEDNYIISLEVCFLRLRDSKYFVSLMNMQRIGCTSVFIKGQLLVFGGRTWGVSREELREPFLRPLVLADSFEKCVKETGSDVLRWDLVRGMGGIPRCYATAVAIDDFAYIIGGYTDSFQISQTSTPKASRSVAAYNNSADHWRRAPELHNARAECGAAALQSFRIYVVGGLSKGEPVEICEFLDLASQTWTMIKEESPIPLGPTSVCWVGKSMYVAGQMSRNLVMLQSAEEDKWQLVYMLPHIYEFIIPITKMDLIRRHST